MTSSPIWSSWRSLLVVVFVTLVALPLLSWAVPVELVQRFSSARATTSLNLNHCITFKKNDGGNAKAKYVHLLEGLNTEAIAVMTNAGNPATPAWPDTAKKCTGELKHPPTVPPDPAAAYHGVITTPAGFRQLASMKCGDKFTGVHGRTQAKTYTFWAVGKYIYYRYCANDDDVNYVYYWGTTDNSETNCVAGHSYPELYAAAKLVKDDLSVDDFKNFAKSGTTIASPAFGMLCSAILVAETARDYNLAILNYVLADYVTDALKLLGGHCPSVIPQPDCKNAQEVPRDGLHPLAWGGALKTMMGKSEGAYRWGQNLGADSDRGKEFEADILKKWLEEKHEGEHTAQCGGILGKVAAAQALKPLLDATYA